MTSKYARYERKDEDYLKAIEKREGKYTVDVKMFKRFDRNRINQTMTGGK
ncbi:hypothetical protein [Vibrio sp. CyArs1]|nr:hypothetical protein [Vibrio sp. CyArs1]